MKTVAACDHILPYVRQREVSMSPCGVEGYILQISLQSRGLGEPSAW